MPHMPAPRGSLVPWHITASFPAHPKEPSPRGALPKHLLEECRVARLHRTPLQLTTGSLCSPWGSPCVPQRPQGDAGTCFLEGKVSLLRRGQGGQAGCATPAGKRQHSGTAELTAGRCRAGSHWALPGRVIALHRTPAWPLAAAGFCHTSHGRPQGAERPHAAAKPSPEQTESGCGPGRRRRLRPEPRHGKTNKQAFLSQGGTSLKRHFLNPSPNTGAAAAPPRGWNICTSGLPFATKPPAWPRRCEQCGHSCLTLHPKVAQL